MLWEVFYVVAKDINMLYYQGNEHIIIVWLFFSYLYFTTSNFL